MSIIIINNYPCEAVPKLQILEQPHVVMTINIRRPKMAKQKKETQKVLKTEPQKEPQFPGTKKKTLSFETPRKNSDVIKPKRHYLSLKFTNWPTKIQVWTKTLKRSLSKKNKILFGRKERENLPLSQALLVSITVKKLQL